MLSKIRAFHNNIFVAAFYSEYRYNRTKAWVKGYWILVTVVYCEYTLVFNTARFIRFFLYSIKMQDNLLYVWVLASISMVQNFLSYRISKKWLSSFKQYAFMPEQKKDKNIIILWLIIGGLFLLTLTFSRAYYNAIL
jgi:hypothetical protein